MKRILSVGLLLMSMSYLGACQNTAIPGQVKESIAVDQFEKKLSEAVSPQLIDVRTANEYTGGHLKDALNIDVKSDDFKDKVAKLDKAKPVFVYCLSGGRSSNSAGMLADMGFKEIHNMDGGIMKWRNAGKPLVMGEARSSTCLTQEAFEKLVAQKEYVLVDFNATWCGPCKKMMPVLASISEKKKDKLSLLKIDADENKELMMQKAISGIPYLELYHNGKLIWAHEGLIEENDLLLQTKL